MDQEENFIEIDKVEDANKIDLKKYTFIRFSEVRNKYLFKKRSR